MRYRRFVIWLFIFGAIVGVIAYLSRLHRPTRLRPRESSDVVIMRRLSRGEPCAISIEPVAMKNGLADRLARISVSTETSEVVVPPEYFADLRDIQVRDGIQVAEFAGELYLLLSGGEGPSAWQAKFTIRGPRVVAREVTREGQTTETVFFHAATVTVGSAALPLASEKSVSVRLFEQRPLRANGGPP